MKSKTIRKIKMDKRKISALCKASLWGACILLFPIFSGVLSAVLSLETTETLFFQGIFMLFSLAVPLIFVLSGKWSWEEIGFRKYDVDCSKKAYHFLPLTVIFIPVAMQGFSCKSTIYVFGNLFLYLTVGIAEEIYFRGIIPRYLRKEFSTKGVILFSTIIFGTGHIAAAFTAGNGWEVFLTMLNAFLFGWLAIEMVLISKNIMPVMLLHFFFDFETKIVVMNGTALLSAECVRGVIVFVAAVWLAAVIRINLNFQQPKRGRNT